MRKGHILLELIIAIALFTIIAGLSFQFSFLYKRAIIQADVEKLYSIMIFLQRQAYLKNKILKLSFNKEKNSYFGENISGQLSDSTCFGIIKGVKGPPSNPDSIILDSISFNNHMILFYPNGTISSGTIYLTDKNKTGLYALTCGISSVAYIRKYKYKDKWQMLAEWV